MSYAVRSAITATAELLVLFGSVLREDWQPIGFRVNDTHFVVWYCV